MNYLNLIAGMILCGLAVVAAPTPVLLTTVSFILLVAGMGFIHEATDKLGWT